MKITYLHQYFNTPEMTGGTRSFEIARRLVAKGHEVNIITSSRDSSRNLKYWFETFESGINVHWLPVEYSNHMGYWKRLKAFFRFAFFSAFKARALKADVIFATSTPLTIAIPAIYAARKLKIPMVFEVRDLWPDVPIAMGAIKSPIIKYLSRKLEKWAYSSSEAVIALSPGMASGVAQKGFPVERIFTIPNSADIDLFRPSTELRKNFRKSKGLADDCVLVTYAGTLGRVNNVDYLVELAFKLKEQKRLVFFIVGDGSEISKIEELAKELGVLGVNFFMFPPVRKKEMPSILAASDFAISTVAKISQLEANSANKFFDGLAAGCCMLINHGGWQEDLLLESGAGVRLSRDLNAAAEQMVLMLSDSEGVNQKKVAARKLAEQRFSRDLLAKRFEDVLVRVVAGNAR